MKIFKKIVVYRPNSRTSKYRIFNLTIIKKLKEEKPNNKRLKKIYICSILFLKINSSETTKKVQFLGLQVFKKESSNYIIKYFILGVPFFKIHTLFSNKFLKRTLNFKKEETPLVSIIIPTYNQCLYTVQCLQSIFYSEDTTPYEIIIADDNSNKQTKKILQKIKNIKLVTNDKNVGYIKNCNNAVKHAKGKFLYFLNNDTIVQKKWLEPLVSVFDLKPNVGVVGSKIFFPNGDLQESGVLMYSDMFNNRLLNDPFNHRNNYLRKCDYVSGCSLMTPKALFEKIGGFDEMFCPAYCDDPDYCLAAKKLGFDTYVQPKSKLIHFGSISYGETNTALMQRNNKMLKEKWKDFFDTRTNYSEQKETSDLYRTPTILIIDDLLPQFDKHAGGKTVFQYCQLFERMGFNVKFCPMLTDVLEEPYYSTLSDMSIEIIKRNEVKDWIYNNVNILDYILLSRPNVAESFMIKSIQARGIKVFYYGHDLHHLRMEREYSLKNNCDEKNEEKIRNMKLLEETIISLCDEAFYPSIIEKEYINKNFNLSNVDVLSPYLYDIKNMPKPKPASELKGLIFVGSSHGPNLDGLMWFIKDVFPIITERNPDIILYIVGSSQSDEVKKLDSDKIKVLGFLTQEELDSLYSNIKISIAPLRYGAGIKGKIIDALYHGVPVVTTSVGAEGISAPKNILNVADTEKEFADAVLKMYDLKNEHANKNLFLEFIKENFSFDTAEKTIKKYIDVSLRKNYGDNK